MKSVKKLLIAITLGSVITITGCGIQKAQKAELGADTQKATAEKQQTSMEDGSQNMRDVLKDMKAQLANKEEDKAIKMSDKLEENWKLFEDGIKEKYKELYKKVEDPLGTIQAAVKVKPLDTKVLTAAIDQLDKVLTEIQNIKKNF